MASIKITKQNFEDEVLKSEKPVLLISEQDGAVPEWCRYHRRNCQGKRGY